MPCDQYELHLENSVAGLNGSPDAAVATLDQSTSKVTAAQLGHINVVLDHKSILPTLVRHGTLVCLFATPCRPREASPAALAGKSLPALFSP